HTRSKRDWSSDVCSSDLGEIARVVGGSHDNSWNVQLSRTCQDTVEVVGGSGDERAGRRLTKERSQCVLVNCIQFQVNTDIAFLSHLKCCDSQAALRQIVSSRHRGVAHEEFRELSLVG